MTDKTDREIMQQALNDLEALVAYIKGGEPDLFMQVPSIEALSERLAQPEQEPVDIGTEWTSCVKLPVTVHVRQQRPGETHVSTREGITPVKPDDLIMRGVSGEEYPIGREIFERTYHLGEAHTKPEHTPQQEVQEPVACIVKGCRNHRGEGLFIGELCSPCHTFITTGEGKYSQAYRNSQREWQGLTNEEVGALTVFDGLHHVEIPILANFVWAVEAKLKEKND